MKKEDYKVYGYRWVVLAVFCVATGALQIQWLSFAPIAREARIFYEASAFQIDLLSIVFMGVFLLMCIPASYIIDTYGIRIGIGIGAAMTGVFGLLKGLFAADYTMVLAAQIGLAVAQPFLLNPVTKLASQWFPISERAMAVGLATLAQFLGIIIAMIATPLLVEKDVAGAYQLSDMLLIYGGISIFAAALVLIFLREQPPTPPVAGEQEAKIQVFAGIKQLFRQRDMLIMLLMFFFGLGMFNAISTCIDQICETKGLTTEQTGMVGGMMLIAGIVGAIILPMLSDKFHKRKLFIIIGMVCMMPGLMGLTFFNDYTLLLISSFVLGFFLLGAGAPVGFQYTAEVTHPVPESTSQGLILLAGQFSGILFIIGMNSFGMIPSLLVFIGFACVNVFLSWILNESKMVRVELSDSPLA